MPVLSRRGAHRMLPAMEAAQSFLDDLRAGPAWVWLWVNFIGAVFALAVPFAAHRVEARAALILMALTAPAMIALHAAIGYSRLLGVVHVVLWTPFAFWLWRRRDAWRARETLSGKWIVLLFATMLVSLAFDYVDVARWLMGERS